jgi:hypothetical protein
MGKIKTMRFAPNSVDMAGSAVTVSGRKQAKMLSDPMFVDRWRQLCHRAANLPMKRMSQIQRQVDETQREVEKPFEVSAREAIELANAPAPGERLRAFETVCARVDRAAVSRASV